MIFYSTISGWIKECMVSSHTAVLINNQFGNLFKVKRGLKKGCPLSPLLFILAADILNRSPELAMRSGLVTGIGEQGQWEVGAL